MIENSVSDPSVQSDSQSQHPATGQFHVGTPGAYEWLNGEPWSLTYRGEKFLVMGSQNLPTQRWCGTTQTGGCVGWGPKAPVIVTGFDFGGKTKPTLSVAEAAKKFEALFGKRETFERYWQKGEQQDPRIEGESWPDFRTTVHSAGKRQRPSLFEYAAKLIDGKSAANGGSDQDDGTDHDDGNDQDGESEQEGEREQDDGSEHNGESDQGGESEQRAGTRTFVLGINVAQPS